MRILLTNDDGYLAPGINTIFKELSKQYEVVMVAPEINMSVTSSSLSIGKSLKLTNISENIFHINGTPADCVHIALCGFLKDKIDLVVSGVNDVANCGDDVIYSGTVGAAIEGRFLGIPAIAVSMDSNDVENYETAAKVVGQILSHIDSAPFNDHTVLNVNIPNIPYEDLKGIKTTRLGYRHMSEGAIPDPESENSYFIGPVGSQADNGEGTDFHALENNYVSITPIGTDLTKFNLLSVTKDWLKDNFTITNPNYQ